MNLKSERLKKLENELNDLSQWLKLGLVPKKDIPKHEEEIEIIKKKVEDEKQRLRFLKESGEVEEYTPPKRGGRQSYQEPQSMPEIGGGAAASEETTEGGVEAETEAYEVETATGEDSTEGDEEASSQIYDENDDPFSDKKPLETRCSRRSRCRPVVGLYFHIPFCNRKCPYCHFYVIPNKDEHKELLLNSLLLEWEIVDLGDAPVPSIYFGGGTPTLFGPEKIATLLSKITNQTSDCEVTIEANPEDVTLALIKAYKEAGINRISLGVQSLVDDSLITLERTHNRNKAIDAIHTTKEAGIDNISIDLMYELPDQTPESFQKTLNQLESLPITHLSLYNLTIEPNTAFFKRTLNLPTQEEGLEMLTRAILTLESIGLKRYEISAFAKPGFESRHNTGYWTARPFYGLGPSAFSYINGTRYRNVANIHRYAKALKEGTSPVDFEEKLPYPQNVHELFAVALRLTKGVHLSTYDLPQKTHQKLESLIRQGYLEKELQSLRLSEKGLLFYDQVASEII